MRPFGLLLLLCFISIIYSTLEFTTIRRTGITVSDAGNKFYEVDSCYAEGELRFESFYRWLGQEEGHALYTNMTQKTHGTGINYEDFDVLKHDHHYIEKTVNKKEYLNIAGSANMYVGDVGTLVITGDNNVYCGRVINPSMITYPDSAYIITDVKVLGKHNKIFLAL